VEEFPDTVSTLKQMHEVLKNLVLMCGYTPEYTENSRPWWELCESAVVDEENLCKILSGRRLFSAMHVMYSMTLQELRATVQALGRGLPKPMQELSCDIPVCMKYII
jgi:hypothetical protein